MKLSCAAGPWCPPAKLYSAGHHLPRLEDERCPGQLPCPCTGSEQQQQQCLTMEAGMLDIPAGNTTVVQVWGNLACPAGNCQVHPPRRCLQTSAVCFN